MKRRAPMRRSRLKPGKPLTSKTQLQRKSPMARTGFSGGARPVTSPGRAPSTLPKVSAKRSRENKVRTEVLKPMKAEQDWCSICGRTGLELNGHELLGAAQGGSRIDPANIVLACNFCNGRCEDEPIAAAAHGWKINGHPLGERRPWPYPSECTA